MPRFIMKVPDRDLYVEWSSIVEAPIAWGSRAEMMDGEEGSVDPERLDRADMYGTSSFIGQGTNGTIYMQLGYLPIENLGKFLDVMTEQWAADEFVDDDPRLLALLQPLDE